MWTVAAQVSWLSPRVGGHSALSPHSRNEPGELSHPHAMMTAWLLLLLLLARTASRCRMTYILPLCFYLFLSFFLSSFFQRLISEVTERILTKLGHIFTYDCYFENLVRTSGHLPPPPPHWLVKTAFWDRLWTLTEHISAMEHDINNWKETCRFIYGLPYMPQIW